MRFAAAATAAAMAGAASAHVAAPPAYNGTAPVYTTEVVTAYTTFCPEATMITHKGETYTVSSATTLTITNCPGGCTITHAASTTPVAPVPYTSAMASSSSVAAPVAASSSVAPVAPVYPSSNGTAPAPVYPTGSGSPVAGSATGTSSPIPSYTGAANKAYSAAGAGVLALFGLVAAL